MTFVIFFTCSLPSFNDMSKHSLVLWPLLLLLSFFFFFVVVVVFCLFGFFFLGGGVCYVLFEKDFLFLF